MTQTFALFLDAYRELNAKKLFWIVLTLSGLVVLAFLGVGINEKGLTVFGMKWPGFVNTDTIDRPVFYKALFVELGLNYWLTWAATILALISTAGIFPDLLTGGSIDLYLAKPIGRLRLFLTKYVAGLAFVFLQVLVFSAASFLVLGVRGGAWLPGVFLAVPVVVVFFSYLYCVCVLLGVLTRSTVTAILLTILFWFAVIAVHSVERTSLKNQFKSQIVTERLDRQIERRQAELKDLEAAAPGEGLENQKTFARGKLKELTDHRAQETSGGSWHAGLYAAKTVLPKTSETFGLMRRWLISAADLKAGRGGDDEQPADDEEPRPMFFGLTSEDLRAEQKVEKVVRARPLSWVVGTSLGFEAVVVALSAWVFCRRDY